MNVVELRQLVCFEAVVRCGGFTRAAEQLHVAQPAVSAQVRRLESELGVQLLARTTRRVALTPAGDLFLARVRRVLEELTAARSELAEVRSAMGGQVRLGVTEAVGGLDVPAALAAFGTRHPGVDLELRTGLVADLLGALDAGALDLLLAPAHDDLPARFAARHLVREELVLVTAPTHPLAGSETLSLAELAGDPFVCLPRGSGLRALLDRATAAAGVTLRVSLEASGPRNVRELVSAGLGVALLARSVTGAPGPPVAVHRVEPPVPHPAIGLVQLAARPLTPAGRALARHLADRSQAE